MCNRFSGTDHEGLLNAKVIVNDFSQGGQAVSGAGGIAINKRKYINRKININSIQNTAKAKKESKALPDDSHARGVVFVFVDSHDKHWSVG